MKNFFVNLIKLILGIIIVLFISEYFFKITSFIGIKLQETDVVKLIIYLLEVIIIYIIYKEELNASFSKYQSKFGNNILYTIISFIVLFITMMLTNYIVKLIANNLKISYEGLNIINIFNEPFDFKLVCMILINLIIIPFVKVVIFILGINNLIEGKSSIFISSLIYALYVGFLMGGNFGNVFINVIPEFILFIILNYLYKKNNSIAFSIMTFICYELFAGLLVTHVM